MIRFLLRWMVKFFLLFTLAIAARMFLFPELDLGRFIS